MTGTVILSLVDCAMATETLLGYYFTSVSSSIGVIDMPC